jgi:PEP-CTERM motif
MKKILLTSIASLAVAGLCGNAFGQGQIVFANSDSSSNFITLNTLHTGPKTGSGLVVELFWNNGSSFVLQDTFTSTFLNSGSGGQSPGQFSAGELTIPAAGNQTFKIEAFYTSGGNEYSGTTVNFTAPVTVSPAPLGKTDTGGNWTAASGSVGDLALGLVVVPEPTTIALGGLGAAALLLFRRRK